MEMTENEGSGDRRREPRCRTAEEHGIVSARVRPGHRVAVIDVSPGGALIETDHRLLPGSTVELHLEAMHRRTTIRGRVLRCAVVGVGSSSVCYRGAIVFDGRFVWPSDSESNGYGVLVSKMLQEPPGRVDTTPDTP